MNKPEQPDALRLADALENWPDLRVDLKAAAAELRRLHAKLAEQPKGVEPVACGYDETTGLLLHPPPQAEVDQQPKGGEPVAEGYFGPDGKWTGSAAKPGFLRLHPDDVGCSIKPLYTHPPSTALLEAAEKALDVQEHILRCIGTGIANIHWSSSTWDQLDKSTDELRAAIEQQRGNA